MTVTTNPSCIGTCKVAAAFGLSPFTFLSLPFAPTVVDSYLAQNEFEFDGYSFPIPSIWRREMSSSTPTHVHASAMGGSAGYGSAPPEKNKKIKASAAKDGKGDNAPATLDSMISATGEDEIEVLSAHFNNLLRQGEWQELEHVLTKAHNHYSAEIKTLLVDNLVGYVDAHGVIEMPIPVLDAGAAFLSPLWLRIFEDHLRRCCKECDSDTDACEAAAILAHPDAPIELAHVVDRFIQDYPVVQYHVVCTARLLLNREGLHGESSELKEHYYNRYIEHYYYIEGYEIDYKIREQDEQKVPLAIRIHKAAKVMTARAEELKKLHQDIAENKRSPLSPLIDRYNKSGTSFLSYETIALALEEGEHTAQDAEMCQIMMRENQLGPWRWKIVEELLNRDTTGSVAKAVFDHHRSEDLGGAYRRRDSVPPEIIELAQTVMQRDPSNIEQTEDAPESDKGLVEKALAVIKRFKPWS